MIDKVTDRSRLPDDFLVAGCAFHLRQLRQRFNLPVVEMELVWRRRIVETMFDAEDLMVSGEEIIGIHRPLAIVTTKTRGMIHVTENIDGFSLADAGLVADEAGLLCLGIVLFAEHPTSFAVDEVASNDTLFAFGTVEVVL
jgi:hypothetical protein